ncbi:unnamed protein product [Diatraea saccharalis]|uniref:Uncharacterized protein n=1 Tax=Diatraea saccharalis TaxID=40085 RepID=A0A9N9RFI7_9NEOP|nr:unnamed protein product [Diatraea saccharalis]
MPDTLSLSAGVSLGLLAGIVSGVCYLVANGLTWPKNEPPKPKRRLPLYSDEGVCRRCGGDQQGGLIPCVCRYHKPVKFESGAWFLRQVQRAISLMPWTISTEKLEQIEEECEGRDSPGPSDGRELRNVRDFLETLSAQLAGGPLEGTRIAPLYDHPAYLQPSRNASPSTAAPSLSGGASGAHAQLKRLVARVVEEAAALPALARYAAEPVNPPSIESSTYEDLLATAILNKVIERYQTENGSGGRSSGIHSASASPTPSERSPPPSLNSRHTRDISPPLREEEDVSDWEEGETIEDALELPRRVPFPEFGGDIVHQDNRDRDFDEVSGSEIQATDGTWEENWLFQKKKIKTIQSVPVPMLVPNSNAEYRALIGDRDADDTTDLSDNVSDQEDDEDNKFKSNIKRVLDSKHVIGGKPKLEELDFEPDSLTILDDAKEFDQFNENQQEEENLTHAINNEINDSKISEEINNLNKTNNFEDGQDSILILGIDSGPPQKAEFSIKEEIHRTILNGNSLKFDQTDSITYTDVAVDVLDGSHNVKGSTNTLSRHEREGEYEETVTIPVQRYADSLRRKHFDDDPHQIPTRDTDNDVDGLIPGSIAYRERKKWLNYVEMPNNPYSPEAIKKRLSTKSTSSLFDMITTKNNEVDDDDEVKVTSDNETGNAKTQTNVENIPERDKIDVTASHTTNSSKLEPVDGYTRMVASPTPKILKDVLAEEVPQYKRYGRDYYIKEAKRSSGARKKNGSISDISSISSLNKSSSLDNIETEFATPVSASSSLSDLEASALHQNIVRAVLSPRNASPNFAINPIFENPDNNDNTDEIYDIHNVSQKANVRLQSKHVYSEGEGYVENEDIVRLKIPIKPEITEDLFETYSNVRRNNTLKSEDLCVRSKRRPGLNYTFGGSLRLNKGFHTDLW